jgi:RNA polymerase sigma factor (sigma-70 family)
MAQPQQAAVLLQYVRRLATDQSLAHLPDRDLLRRFAVGRDEQAFAALVRRHGAMVLNVGQRVLHNGHDAEDVFQATFLVLTRKAGSLRWHESVGNWLYQVAYRIARKARAAAARRAVKEARAAALAPVEPHDDLTWREVEALLDEELHQLPVKYRVPLVFCYLEGVTRDEAAQQLGWSLSTLKRRLERGRELLRLRLVRRGLTLSAALSSSMLTQNTTQATLAHGLVQATLRTALQVAAGQPMTGLVSAQVAALVKGGLKTMLVTKLKVMTALLLAVSVVGGAGVLAHQALTVGETPLAGQQSAVSSQQPEPAAAKPRAAREESDSVEVSGRVLDPEGRPVAGAKVMFHQRRPHGELAEFIPASVTGTTDADGRFRFSGSVRENGPAGKPTPMLTLTAHVPGYGPAATVEASSPDELKDRTLRLVKDDVPIRGRILSLEGKPVSGVTVRPVAVVANAANDLGRLVKAIETNTWADLPDDQRANIVFSAAAAGLTQTALTDSEGKFTLSGFGRERIVVLRLDGPTIQTCLLNAMTRVGPTVRATRPQAGGGLAPPRPVHPPSATNDYAHGATFDFAPGRALVVEGAARDRDTGKPLAGVVVRQGIAYDFGWAEDELTTTTDASGNYRLVGVSRPSARGAIEFVPPGGQPYLTAGFSPPAADLGQPVRLDVSLQRGVLIKGRVTDKATGQPVQAVVPYLAFANNPSLRGMKGFEGSQVVSSKKDGSFTLAALRGRGIVAAKTDDMRRGAYLYGQGMDAIGGLLFNAQLGGNYFETRPYLCFSSGFDTLAGIEPDAKAESVACDLQLDSGKTVKGTILDPDGKPLAGVSIRGPFLVAMNIRALPSEAFTIPAVNSHKPAAYFFEHHKKNLAAAVILKGDEGAGFTVNLEPTATVTGRVVTEDGEPVGSTDIHGRLEAGQLNMTQNWNGFFWGRTDADGRFKIEGLLPGVKLGADIGESNLFTNLMLKPGEVRNLGDIHLKNIPE